MDDIDRKLLNLLTENCRARSVSLARELGVSRTTVQNRIDRLRKNGIIKKFTIELDQGYSRRIFRGLMTVHIQPGKAGEVVRAFQKIVSIVRVLSVSGSYDFFLEISVEEVSEFDQVIADIRKISGVSETQSSVVLKEYT